MVKCTHTVLHLNNSTLLSFMVMWAGPVNEDGLSHVLLPAVE